MVRRFGVPTGAAGGLAKALQVGFANQEKRRRTLQIEKRTKLSELSMERNLMKEMDTIGTSLESVDQKTLKMEQVINQIGTVNPNSSIIKGGGMSHPLVQAQLHESELFENLPAWVTPEQLRFASEHPVIGKLFLDNLRDTYDQGVEDKVRNILNTLPSELRQVVSDDSSILLASPLLTPGEKRALGRRIFKDNERTLGMGLTPPSIGLTARMAEARRVPMKDIQARARATDKPLSQIEAEADARRVPLEEVGPRARERAVGTREAKEQFTPEFELEAIEIAEKVGLGEMDIGEVAPGMQGLVRKELGLPSLASLETQKRLSETGTTALLNRVAGYIKVDKNGDGTIVVTEPQRKNDRKIYIKRLPKEPLPYVLLDKNEQKEVTDFLREHGPRLGSPGLAVLEFGAELFTLGFAGPGGGLGKGERVDFRGKRTKEQTTNFVGNNFIIPGESKEKREARLLGILKGEAAPTAKTQDLSGLSDDEILKGARAEK